MNKQFVNTIFNILAKSIDTGYKQGISSIIKSARKDLTVEFAVRDKPKFKVDYTATDIAAIENFKINAFKVAGVGSWQLERELNEIGTKFHSGEIDRDTFEILTRQKMQHYGIELGTQPPSGWIQQNLDIAIKNSIAGARWNRVTDPELKGLYSHWIYHTQLDDAVREDHQVLEGEVFAVADVTASLMLGSNDYGCRCYEEYITQDEAKGLDVSKGIDRIENIPADFRYNPGSGKDVWRRWTDEKFLDMPSAELDALQKMITEKFN